MAKIFQKWPKFSFLTAEKVEIGPKLTKIPGGNPDILKKGGAQNGPNSLRGENIEKMRGPKMAKIQYRVQPDI